MVGRFKLSQDRNDTDRHLAAVELMRNASRKDRVLVEVAVGARTSESPQE